MIEKININGVEYAVTPVTEGESTNGVTVKVDGVTYLLGEPIVSPVVAPAASAGSQAIEKVQVNGALYDIADVEGVEAEAQRATEAESSLGIHISQVEETVNKTNADIAETKKNIASSLHASSVADSVNITGKSDVGRTTFSAEIPAATTEKAGVMSAEDKKNLNYSTQRLELVQHRQFNLFKIDATNPEYNSIMHDIDNAIKELYIKTKRDNLKVGLLQKEGVGGVSTSMFIVWDSDTKVFYVNIEEEEAFGTKLYKTDEYTVVIDWDKVNFRYTNLSESRYIVSDNVFSEYYSFNRLINSIDSNIETIETNIEDIDSNIETIKNDVNIITPALTEIIEQVPNVYTCERGGYTTGGINNDDLSRFRVSQPLLSKDVVSIYIDNSFVDKYGLFIWGNDDGYGYPIQSNSGFTAVTSWVNNNKYKYIFVFGEKKDGTKLDDVDLEEIKSILVVENNVLVGYMKCATADEV